jgi:hypothetical protein
VGLVGLVGIAVARYGATWLEAFEGLSSQARRTGSIGLAKWLGDVGLGHRAILVTIGVATLAAFAWLAREAWHGRRRLGVSGSVAALGQGWLNRGTRAGECPCRRRRRTGWPGCSRSG